MKAIGFIFTLILCISLCGCQRAILRQRTRTSNKEIPCFDPLGCFPPRHFKIMNYPFSYDPESTEELNLTFKLYTYANTKSSIDLKFNLTASELAQTSFDGRKVTVFIIHGFTSSFNESGWTGEIKNLLFDYEKTRFNIFGVDWSGGASPMNYYRRVANTQVVGAALAYFIESLSKFSGLDPDRIHIIGHSLGAHVAGYAGKKLQTRKIGRITGFDPARPWFFEDNHRLNAADGKYVEIIHTDHGRFGLGLEPALAYTDFYPNGGMEQPGCSKSNTIYNLQTQGVKAGLTETVTCNHQFAHRLMRLNYNKLPLDCQFVGYQCPSYEDFENGLCTDCGEDGMKCAPLSLLGFDYKKLESRAIAKKYFFKTSKRSPYCLYHYGITFSVAKDSPVIVASFTLSFFFENSTLPFEISLPPIFPNTLAKTLLTSDKRLANFHSVTLSWQMEADDSDEIPSFDLLYINYMSHMAEWVRVGLSAVLCQDRTHARVINEKRVVFVQCHDYAANSPFPN